MIRPVPKAWLNLSLLLIGAALAIALKPGRPDATTLVAVGIAGLLSALPATRHGVTRALEWLAARRSWQVALPLFLGALALLTTLALAQKPYLPPKSHDERSYKLQSLHLATGHLSLPAPPAPDFFESFHIVTRPRYASVYFPGTALLHLPARWIAPTSALADPLISLTLTAAGITLTYLALRRPLGGDMALLAAVLLLGAVQLRAQSILIMSQVPAFALGTAGLWLAQRYREKPMPVRALALGAVAGLLIITRPQDAACYLPAVGLLATWGQPARKALSDAGFALAAAAPCLVLLFAQNVILTGSPLHTAFGQYIAANQPAATFLAAASQRPPETTLPQKVAYNALFAGEQQRLQARGVLHDLLSRRIPDALRALLPAAPLALLLPAGLAALLSRSRRFLLIPLAGFLLIYGLLYTFYLPHYPVAVAAPLVALIAAAPLSLGCRAPVVLLSLALTLASLPLLNPQAADLEMATDTLALLDRVEADLPQKPALLLITYTPGDPLHQEPVYNLRHAAITDHDVIRAHDLGPRNPELFRALAPLTPHRQVYRFDRRTRTLTDLGPLPNLAANAPATH